MIQPFKDITILSEKNKPLRFSIDEHDNHPEFVGMIIQIEEVKMHQKTEDNDEYLDIVYHIENEKNAVYDKTQLDKFVSDKFHEIILFFNENSKNE